MNSSAEQRRTIHATQERHALKTFRKTSEKKLKNVQKRDKNGHHIQISGDAVRVIDRGVKNVEREENKNAKRFYIDGLSYN